MGAFADMSDEQLVHKMLDNERLLVSYRFKHSQNQLENTASLKGLRRDIARLHTEARKRETEAGLSKDALVAKYRGSYKGTAPEASEAEAGGGFLQGFVDKLTTND